MARIIIPAETLVGRSLNSLTVEVIMAKQRAERLKAVVDQITNNGTAKQLLETSTESRLPVGSGAAIYDGLTQIQTSLNSLSTLLAAIDLNP